MENIRTADTALVNLARHGDPTAFLTLTEPTLRQFVAGLDQDLTPEEGLNRVLDLLRECYRSYVRKQPSQPPAAWCARKLEKLRKTGSSADDSAAEAVLTPEEEAYLHQEAQRALFRERTQLRRSSRGRNSRDEQGSRFWKSAFGKVLLLAMILVAVVALAGTTLVLTHTAVTIVVTSPRGAEILRFPPAATNTPRPQPVAPQPAETVNQAIDSVAVTEPEPNPPAPPMAAKKPPQRQPAAQRRVTVPPPQPTRKPTPPKPRATVAAKKPTPRPVAKPTPPPQPSRRVASTPGTAETEPTTPEEPTPAAQEEAPRTEQSPLPPAATVVEQPASVAQQPRLDAAQEMPEPEPQEQTPPPATEAPVQEIEETIEF